MIPSTTGGTITIQNYNDASDFIELQFVPSEIKTKTTSEGASFKTIGFNNNHYHHLASSKNLNLTCKYGTSLNLFDIEAIDEWLHDKTLTTPIGEPNHVLLINFGVNSDRRFLKNEKYILKSVDTNSTIMNINGSRREAVIQLEFMRVSTNNFRNTLEIEL